MVLEEVFKRLNKEGIEVILDDSQPRGVYCRYGTNVVKLNSETSDFEGIVPEYLEVGNQDERIILEYYGNKPTIVTYSGKDIYSMFQNLKDLRLSSSFDNLGEGVLSRFRFGIQIAIDEGKCGFGSIQQKILSGKEKHFVFVLNKLLNLYRRNVMQPQS